MTKYLWSFTSSRQFGQPVWLWSSSLYQPLSFLLTLSLDGMIIQSWHICQLRLFPSDSLWISNASSSRSYRREEDSLQSWHNLCTATACLQRVHGSIRSWRSSFVTLVRSACVHGFAFTFNRARPNKETCLIWPCKVGEIKFGSGQKMWVIHTP